MVIEDIEIHRPEESEDEEAKRDQRNEEIEDIETSRGARFLLLGNGLSGLRLDHGLVLVFQNFPAAGAYG